MYWLAFIYIFIPRSKDFDAPYGTNQHKIMTGYLISL